MHIKKANEQSTNRKFTLVLCALLIVACLATYIRVKKENIVFADPNGEKLAFLRESFLDDMPLNYVTIRSNRNNVKIEYDYDPYLCNRFQPVTITVQDGLYRTSKQFQIALIDHTPPVVEKIVMDDEIPMSIKLEDIPKYFRIYDPLQQPYKNLETELPLQQNYYKNVYAPGNGGYTISYKGELNPSRIDLNKDISSIDFIMWDGYGNYSDERVVIHKE